MLSSLRALSHLLFRTVSSESPSMASGTSLSLVLAGDVMLGLPRGEAAMP